MSVKSESRYRWEKSGQKVTIVENEWQAHGGSLYYSTLHEINFSIIRHF